MSLAQCFSTFNVHIKSPGGSFVGVGSDSIGLGWDLIVCISKKLPGASGTDGPRLAF